MLKHHAINRAWGDGSLQPKEMSVSARRPWPTTRPTKPELWSITRTTEYIYIYMYIYIYILCSSLSTSIFCIFSFSVSVFNSFGNISHINRTLYSDGKDILNHCYLAHTYISPVSWDCRIHRMHFYKGVRTPKRVSWIWQWTIWLWGSSNTGSLGNAEHPFIATTPRYSLAWSGRT